MSELSDNENFTMLLTKHQRRLIGYLRLLVPKRVDADDILQEVNLYLCQHASEYQPDTNFNAWMLKVAHYRVLKWRANQSRERIVFDEQLFERLVGAAEIVDQRAEQRQEALKLCMKRLSADERLLVTEFYSNPQATAQLIAERIGRRASGIYVMLKRVRLKLHECIVRRLENEERAS